MLCIGLDTDVERLPSSVGGSLSGLVEFNRRIVEATSDICCGYKLNWAFYEQYGSAGIAAIEQTLTFIPDSIITIADAKRGDIGNTSAAYAKTFFQEFRCDAVTVAPYMGYDSVQPFLEYADAMTFVLALTSNKGSEDFQRLPVGGKPLYQHVMETALGWTRDSNIGFVVGATHPQELAALRTIAPTSPFLIPGIGAQGGDIEAIVHANNGAPALINASRAVIYASQDNNFAEKAREAASELNRELNSNNAHKHAHILTHT